MSSIEIKELGRGLQRGGSAAWNLDSVPPGYKRDAKNGCTLVSATLVDWTVIGHEWKLHISWREDKTGDVVGQP
jgi:hypothetical protein